MIELCSRESCTGCEACRNACPEGCIRMVADSEGFLWPEIDESKCIHCNRCRNICPILGNMPSGILRKDSPQIYACWNNDKEVRRQSSSGGVFSAIAMSILSDGGVVFGAAFDENMHLRHMGVEDTNGLGKLLRSKYVQSEIGESFKHVKDFLIQGRRVLFVGAPCQVAGLNMYLDKDYDNLITADFICHGVPSPGVFGKYVKYIENIYACRLKDINFRDKRKGWSNGTFVIARLDNGKEVMLTGRKNGFIYGFLVNLFLRKSCYRCLFRTTPRCADFTIADFWGIESRYPNEAHKGISCLMVNSTKGQGNMDLWKSKLSFFEESFDLVKKNLYSSMTVPQQREQFFVDLNTRSFSEITSKYLTPPLRNRIRIFIKSRLNLKMIRFLKNWMGLI